MGTWNERLVTAAVDRVLHDVTVELGADAVRIDISFGTRPELGISTTEVTPTSTGLFLHPGESEVQLVVRLADTVQDCLAESTRYWGRAWPHCPTPSHRHPLTAVASATGTWVCPVTGDTVAEIGHLERP